MYIYIYDISSLRVNTSFYISSVRRLRTSLQEVFSDKSTIPN